MPELQFDGRRRVVIEGVSPLVDDGRFPAKRVIGDVVPIEADIFADGHDLLAAVLLHRHESESEMTETTMIPLVNDRWRAEITVGRLGFYFFAFEAWIDHFATWHRDLRKRVDAGVSGNDLDVQLQTGVGMIRAAATRATDRDRKRLDETIKRLEGSDAAEEKVVDLWHGELLDLMRRNAERKFATRDTIEHAIEVDPRRAGFSTWYELFPRSAASEAGRHGTFRDVEAQLPRIARMGFDILYLPPIHPIGTTFRKGPNNTVSTETSDPGSPWAIGAKEGGHKEIHSDLGTLDDFRRLVEAARSRGIELAMDIAFQASPDHPYVAEHDEWFQKRPDGTIQYAENPPKKYQDIYPFHFESDAWTDLWKELCGIFRYWIDNGVRVFRVDNPHTKPLPFWHWVIRTVKKHHPDVIFLAEAFTRPKIMYWLGKAGFSQSYTYFAWRNSKYELTEYFEQITKPPVSDFFRPNAWPNTPDIFPEYLQYGGRPAFVIRLMLAATLSSNYGIYGPAFERSIGDARDPGGEEYRDSEKYEIKHWPPADDDLTELIAVVNRIRRQNPALQQNTTLKFHETTNDEIICYSKSADDESVLMIVNVDPHNTQAGYVELDLTALNLDANRPFQVHELLSGARYTWHGPRNYVKLDPNVVPAHIFRIRRKVRSEQDFEYFL
ncbi:MAG TPA: alpha-1,4-glucan--maltose-1-phosphate maltosyltransferase [Thermoanaerobaculia bacterium]|nr:alpha-1,4-glucan--maltose-1-phosphate maltosyltransferase [Thermoanaerobaculia bacterium]